MLRALLFGEAGQVGRAVQQSRPSDIVLIVHDADSVDITDATAVAAAVRDARPNVILNCAAFTQVDEAEVDVERATAINAHALHHIGVSAQDVGARVVHLSTDYVFDGSAGAPYDIADETHPLSVYGRTKRDGERALLNVLPSATVMRTAWVHAGGCANFVTGVMRRLEGGQSMKVVDDQIGTPTRAAHLAQAMWRVVERDTIRGVLHFTDSGVASWFDVAVCIHEALEDLHRVSPGVTVTPTSTEQFPRPATRPRCGVLDKHSSWAQLGWVPPHWRSGVMATVTESIDA